MGPRHGGKGTDSCLSPGLNLSRPYLTSPYTDLAILNKDNSSNSENQCVCVYLWSQYVCRVSSIRIIPPPPPPESHYQYKT